MYAYTTSNALELYVGTCDAYDIARITFVITSIISIKNYITNGICIFFLENSNVKSKFITNQQRILLIVMYKYCMSDALLLNTSVFIPHNTAIFTEIIMWGPQTLEQLIEQELEYSSTKYVDLTQMVRYNIVIVIYP